MYNGRFKAESPYKLSRRAFAARRFPFSEIIQDSGMIPDRPIIVVSVYDDEIRASAFLDSEFPEPEFSPRCERKTCNYSRQYPKTRSLSRRPEKIALVRCFFAGTTMKNRRRNNIFNLYDQRFTFKYASIIRFRSKSRFLWRLRLSRRRGKKRIDPVLHYHASDKR